MANKHDLEIAKGAAEVIRRLMDEQGVSRSELARLTHKTPSYVSQVLNPGSYAKAYGPQGVDGATGVSGSEGILRKNIPTITVYENFADKLGASLNLKSEWTVTPKPGTGKLVPKKQKGGKDV